jgi:hypothetical protein
MQTGGRRRSRIPLALLAAIGAVACGHSEPFPSEPPRLDEPLDPAPPVRLTYSGAPDLSPAWTADGATIAYSAAMSESREGDTCIGLMPVGGGTLRGRLCPSPLATEDTLTVYDRPAVSGAGRVAYVVLERRPSDQRGWRSRDLVVRSLAGPHDAVRLGPVASADFSTLSSLRWLDDERLVYVGEREESIEIGPGVSVLVSVGRAIATRDAAAGAAPRLVPGLDNPSSVTPAGDGAVFATVAGDTRVYRVDLETGGRTVVHDFGAAGIARDLHAAGGRLAAIVGGVVRVVVAPDGRRGHIDSGGNLYVIDLATGAARRIGDPLPVERVGGGFALYDRPALSPDGRTLVAEAYQAKRRVLDATVQPPLQDTVLTTTGDLWQFDGL